MKYSHGSSRKYSLHASYLTSQRNAIILLLEMFMVDFLIYKTRITAGSKQEQVRWIKNDHKKKKLKWLDAVCFIQRVMVGVAQDNVSMS